MLQGVVAEGEASDEVMKIAEELTMESSVRATGSISKHPKWKGVYEMQIKKIEVIQMCKDEFPISKKEHGPDFFHSYTWSEKINTRVHAR